MICYLVEGRRAAIRYTIGQGGDPMKKALPIGIENFEDMVKSGYYYVDKTLFIKELLDLKADDGYPERTAFPYH